jgi:glycolate oxidase FAD binding subunit
MVSVDNDLDKYIIDGISPAKTVSPKSPESLADLLRIASENQWRVVPFGFGQMMCIGSISTGYDIALDLTEMPKYIQHNSEDLTVTCSNTVSYQELSDKLKEKNQWLPLDSPRIDSQSIGALLACNLPSPFNASFGYLRDYALGMKTATPFGKVTKSGGTVVKNVTGFDLTRLHIGALGTLGIITEASFKIIPMPEKHSFIKIVNTNIAHLLDVNSQIYPALGSVGVSELLIKDTKLGELYLHYVGTERIVNQKLLEMKTVLFDHEINASVEEIDDSDWCKIRDFGWTDSDKGIVLLRINCVPSDTENIINQINRLVPNYDQQEFETLSSFKRGVIKCKLKSQNIKDIQTLILNIRDAVRAFNGYTVVEKSQIPHKKDIDIWGYLPESFTLMKKIKSEFDPFNIMNIGRFIGGI